MSEKIGNKEKKDTNPDNKKSFFEKGTRFGRDFNIAVGGVALVGAALAPPVLAAGLGIYAGINFAQAAGFEVFRRQAKSKNAKKHQNKK